MNNITFEKLHNISFVLNIVLIFVIALNIGNILVTGECSVLNGVVNGLIAIMWLLYAMRKMVERM